MTPAPKLLADGLWRWTARHGHPAAARRLDDQSGFEPIEPGDDLPGGVSAFAIGSPRRYEQPLFIRSHGALAFGDAVVEVDGALRVWEGEPADERRTRWYRDRFIPTSEPLLALEPKRVLVTHGEPVLADGRARLESALAAPPWNRGSD